MLHDLQWDRWAGRPSDRIWSWDKDDRNLKNGNGYQLQSLHNADVTHGLDVIHQRAPQAAYGYNEAIAR